MHAPVGRSRCRSPKTHATPSEPCTRPLADPVATLPHSRVVSPSCARCSCVGESQRARASLFAVHGTRPAEFARIEKVRGHVRSTFQVFTCNFCVRPNSEAAFCFTLRACDAIFLAGITVPWGCDRRVLCYF